MDGLLSYVLSKKFTEETAEEFGALKGASCQIQSITNITDSSSSVIGKRINFVWENTAGETRTESCDIMYGEKGDTGLGVKSVDVDASNHLIVTYDDDSTEDAGEIKNVTTSISRITDIDLDNLQDGQILKYNATTEKWENQSPGSVDTNLGDLNDVDFDNLTDGQTIIWDAANSKWKNADSSADIQSIGDIDDVDITTPTDGQMLKYNGTSEKWENADMPTIDSAPTENSTNAVQSGGVYTALGGKVDNHSTEGVPDRLMTATEGTKLAGIAEGAEVNVQADWEQSDDTADDFIKNKPTIPDAQIQSDWEQTTVTAKDYIKNKPTLGTAAAKDSTTYVNPNNHDLPDANSVYQAMTSMLEGAFHPAGNKTVAELTSALLVQANVGNVYKITDSGTTDANWVGGAGQTITAGQMAVVVYGNTASTFLFNLENGINIDMSAYQTKLLSAPITVDGTQKTNVEDTLGAINTLAAGNKTDIGNIKDGTSIDSFADVESALGNKADKSEMSVTDGTGADADKTTIQLKSGTSATVLKTHQDITGKADKTQLAEEFSVSTTYRSNDYVRKDGVLYRFTRVHKGAWDASHVSATPISTGIGVLNTNIRNIRTEKLQFTDFNITNTEYSSGEEVAFDEFLYFMGDSERVTPFYNGCLLVFKGNGTDYIKLTLTGGEVLNMDGGLILTYPIHDSSLSEEDANHRELLLIDSSKSVYVFDVVFDMGEDAFTYTYTKLATSTEVASKADITDIAPAFSDSTSYVVGTYCTYNGNLYRCNTAHSGAWVAADFTQITVMDEVGAITDAQWSEIETILA